jgi:hypothetical protein
MIRTRAAVAAALALGGLTLAAPSAFAWRGFDHQHGGWSSSGGQSSGGQPSGGVGSTGSPAPSGGTQPSAGSWGRGHFWGGGGGGSFWRSWHPQPQPQSNISTTDLPGWAGYYTNDVAFQASTIVTVPSIDCSSNPDGAFAGQAEGVELLNNYNGTAGFADLNVNGVVRTYCIGTSANYDTAIYLPDSSNPTTEDYDGFSTGVSVQPGDHVAIDVTTTASSSTVLIVNLSNGERDSMSGPGITDAGPNIGLAALDGDSTGPHGFGNVGPQLPVPASRTGFAADIVDGQPLLVLDGLGAQDWVDPNNTSDVVAAPTPILGFGWCWLDSFDVDVTAS